MRLRTLASATAFALAALVAVPASASATWSPWFSEDTNPNWQWCDTAEAVSGVRCSGSYCDNVSIRCETMPYGITGTGYHWTQWFSEEGSDLAVTISHPNPDAWYPGDMSGNMHVCNADGAAGIVTGWACSGRYCDNTLLECATPMYGSSPARMTGCFWSGWYSEEDPWFAYGVGSNRFITGVECSGSYCDNKRYYVCSLAPPADSCEDHCGGTSYDLTCFCDSLCTYYGDCCDDYAATCG